MSGWIKIHRSLLRHWIAQDTEKLGRWIDLLLLANYEDNKVLVGEHLVDLKRGQLIASLAFLAERWNTSKSTVLRFLDLLESETMVKRCVQQKLNIITICNYDSYQAREDDTRNDACNDDETTVKRSWNETKKEEEYILSSTTNAHAHTCEEVPEREAGFAERFREEGLWYETAKVAGIDPHSIFDVFESFCFEHKYTQHADYADFRRHFISYCRKKVEIGKDSNSAPASGKQSAWDYNSQLAAELGIIN